jgi:pyruvate dehydrogenase E2 component (dihydrolipoamide acetyltransferase)
MTVGTIGSWGKKIGEKVGPGDSIAEVQTDKASMAFESQEDFIIAKYLVEVGAEVPVGAPILVSKYHNHLFATTRQFQHHFICDRFTR